MAADFLVNRTDLHDCRVTERTNPDLAPGEVLLAVDAFGLTTNNITYAVFGAAMSYWEFFPAEDGWGRVPVWGFADVVDSEHDEIATGTRVYGYLPPSTHLVVAPGRVSARTFLDTSPHRAALPAAYNSYTRVTGDPAYTAAHEPEQMLLQPLFFTSFLLDDFLGEADMFGARAAVLSSASSKTALALAFLLSRREGVDVVGLTSPRSVEFVEGVGVYDRVVTYEDVASLPVVGSVYVDMAGDSEVRGAVHARLGNELAHSCAVGVTHREQMGATADLPGPAPQFFFAPDRVGKRSRDWGADGLAERLGEAWTPFVDWSTGWLVVDRDHGPEAVTRVYLDLLEGRADPTVGHVLSMSP